MNKDDISGKIKTDEDYIRCPKCSNSLSKFLEKNPDGAEDSVIAKVLMVTEEKIREIYKEAVELLRKSMSKSGE